MIRVFGLNAAAAVCFALSVPALAPAKEAAGKQAGNKREKKTGASCAVLGKVKGLLARFKAREQHYLKDLRCSIDAWHNYLKERAALLKVGGVARKAAQKALADLDRRNERLRRMRDKCNSVRQELENLIAAFNTEISREESALRGCGVAYSPIVSAYKRDYRPFP
jgi:hypothetical protein